MSFGEEQALAMGVDLIVPYIARRLFGAAHSRKISACALLGGTFLVLCVLGPNCCGKTTLLRALAGVLLWRGYVEADGIALQEISSKQRAKRIALMSQFSQTAFDYTVYETVMLGRYAHQRDSLFSTETTVDRGVVEDALRRTGAWELRDQSVTRLSGGQLQRMFHGISLALAFEDTALLLKKGKLFTYGPVERLDLELLDRFFACT